MLVFAYPLAHGGLHLLVHLAHALHHNGIVVPLWVYLAVGVGVAIYFAFFREST